MSNIRKRGENTYFFTVSLGQGLSGKYPRKYKTYKVTEKMTPKQLEKHLELEYAKFEQLVKSENYIDPEKMSFTEFVKQWTENFAENSLSETTIANHLNRLQNHILPTLGQKRIDKIKGLDIINLLNNLKRKDNSDDPLAISTKIDVYRTLKSVFKYAFKWEIIASDPMEKVDKPIEKNKTKKAANVYDEEEVNALLLTVQRQLPHWRIFVTLCLTAGLRRSEALGLEWSSVDFKKMEIDINTAIVKGRKGAVIKSTKNESSHRLISIPKFVAQELKEYKLHWKKERFRMGDKWTEEEREWLFCNENGKHFYPTTPTLWWGRFTKRANVRHIRLHDLRHTSATLLIAQNIHAKIISERLGHSRINTTMDIYGHALRSADRGAADSMDNLFSKRL
ncbi:tyrosine-type recombinase/integrase [Shouchella lonarensis]|uniref:Integrase n=1 Tax=Shouchella lonarensis TaxID=1464122 RepID=A0A1G6IGU0_9BACI|nr:tyrosine-type recombinase/integrase [Shouchella lonarensis]SDC05698.1 integrase [Shouchella lonarensis]